MRQEIAYHVQRIDQKLRVFDADVNMGAEDEQLLRQDLHILFHAGVTLKGGYLLLDPQRERM